MPLTVKLSDVIEALEEAGEEHTHYLDKRTGEIVMITNEEMEAAEEDELISEYPDWQRESILKAREIFNSDESFIALPDQSDIHEYKIMEDFCLAFKDRRVGEYLLGQIKGSGAFRRFKDAIYSKGLEEAWYQFRRMEFERIAIEWLEEEGISYTREDATDVSHLV
ncbi:MAG: hypothetical protein H0V18_10225 [Pyrinomonadaceae bacterium]|nr:hypothetical protein [Pyrinomonadaceae bacterium]